MWWVPGGSNPPPCGGVQGGQTWVPGGSKGGLQGGQTQVGSTSHLGGEGARNPPTPRVGNNTFPCTRKALRGSKWCSRVGATHAFCVNGAPVQAGGYFCPPGLPKLHPHLDHPPPCKRVFARGGGDPPIRHQDCTQEVTLGAHFKHFCTLGHQLAPIWHQDCTQEVTKIAPRRSPSI